MAALLEKASHAAATSYRMFRMSLLNTRSKYGSVSLALHWIIVLAIVGQWLLAEAGEESNVVSGLNPLSLHQSIGISVLLLTVIRLAWRLLNPTPAWPADIKPYEITLARVVYVSFYLLLFAIPISGWGLSSVEDEPLRFFNLFDLPRIVLAGEDTLEEVHEVLFNLLVALAALHVLGAAKHLWARRSKGKAIAASG
jgi:cytochrome b561